MLFDKSDRKANDRVIYTAKPNILFGCKKAIFGVILLIIILTLSSMAIRFVGNMQTYLISRINISLASYTAIAFFVIILITVIYIIWQLVGWYSVEYMLTDTKIIIKSGVLSTKRNYMPYTTIQDLNTSQSIIARMFNVGSVSVFSAYDNNQMELKYINNPSEVEDMIFSRMGGYRNFQAPPQHIPHQPKRGYANDEGFFYEDYVEKDTYEEYYDEYEPITPINHEKNTSHRNESDIPPQNFKKTSNKSRHRYEYEPYNSGFNRVPNIRMIISTIGYLMMITVTIIHHIISTAEYLMMITMRIIHHITSITEYLMRIITVMMITMRIIHHIMSILKVLKKSHLMIKKM